MSGFVSAGVTWNGLARASSVSIRFAIGLLLIFGSLAIGRHGSVNADEPHRVAYWGFGSEDASQLHLHGDVQRDQAGPRPDEFPDFSDDNTAYRFSGGGYVSAADPGDQSYFDFANGDAITLESWVNVQEDREGQFMYVVAKGRSDSPQFARDNQNWALRIAPKRGAAHLSFLFATSPDGPSSHWHRWTSKNGFGIKTGWHHVAVAYRFGTPDSIRGWIDGIPSDGDWDMGGATKLPPVVDNDSVWIGAARGGSPSNGFHGLIDEVAIHREIIDDETMASRFHRAGGPIKWGPQPEVMPDIDSIPQTAVLATFAEGLPSPTRWLNEGEDWPSETSRWSGREFLLHRLPTRFDEWGIRTGWKAPVLIRLAADVELPPGEHRFLIRARGLSRLWIDGNLIARTEAKYRKRTNLEPVEPVAKPPAPGARPHGFSQQEAIGVWEILASEGDATRPSRVVFELVVGGPNLRTETTEVCLAIQYESTGQFFVLTPSTKPSKTDSDRLESLSKEPDEVANPDLLGTHRLPLTDQAVEPALKRIERSLIAHENTKRRAASSTLDPFWKRRHAEARKGLAATSETASGPSNSQIVPDPTSIDGWIERKIEQGRIGSLAHDERTTQHFHQEVLPILREQCFRCHGEKDQGGLKLNTREQAIESGDSELPAIVPGDPDASELVQRIRSGDMPPTDDGLTADQIATLESWIESGAAWPTPPVPDSVLVNVPKTNDSAFLRRVHLDIVGVPPTETQARSFLTDTSPDKRERLIDRLLNDQRYADKWVSFWMDILAENPTLLNASLNSTGPFRWFLHDALRDGKPLDRMVTELIVMRGTTHDGGSAGFGLAGENDAPMAEKGHILASSLLGIDLQCARCHDSPYHSTTQEDLFSLAAMLERKSITPPATSRVPDEFFEDQTRASLIRVSLPLGQAVEPKWPFAETTGVTDSPAIESLMLNPKDSRERLAALITAPDNRRFPRVMVNHLWKQLIGTAIVEPVHDWEGRTPSHPELLDWLSNQLVSHNYDPKHVLRLIMRSQLYQKEAVGENLQAAAESRFFNAPDRRRLTAEQVVDSLYQSCGAVMAVEELTFVHDGVHPINKRLTLGRPSRAWMMASLNNERDRPSLSLPRAQPIADVMQAFGWTGSRQKPIVERETSPNVLQPGILANGTLTMSLTRASQESTLAELAVEAESPESLVETLFLRFLARMPTATERSAFAQAIASGFEDRLATGTGGHALPVEAPLPQVTWTNHLVPEANEIQLEVQRRVLAGPPPDHRLNRVWRETYEDIVWTLVNDSEFVWIP